MQAAVEQAQLKVTNQFIFYLLCGEESKGSNRDFMFDLFHAGILGRALEIRGCNSDGTWGGDSEVGRFAIPPASPTEGG